MHACIFLPRMSRAWLSTSSLCIFKLLLSTSYSYFLLSLLGGEHKAMTSPFSDVEENSNQRWMVPGMIQALIVVL